MIKVNEVKIDRDKILSKTDGKCMYCGCDLSGTKWQADHLYPVIRVDGVCRNPELDVFDNLFPSCGPCNNFKGPYSIEGMRFRVQEQFYNIPKSSTGMRQLIRLGLVDMSEKPVKFWFEENGIEVKPMHEIAGFHKDTCNVVWHKEPTEPNCFYADIGRFVVSLRSLGKYWLAIATAGGFSEQYRIEIPNGSIHKDVAASWALRL